MLQRPALGLAFAVACSITAPALAELSGDDYAPTRAITSEFERARVQALIDAARAREAERATRQEAEQAAGAAWAAAAQAAQPPGARLAAQHCTTCHAPEVLAGARHTLLGWACTIARMRWLNGAAISAADAALIRAHLSRTQPAGLLGAIVEYGAFGLMVTGLLAALLRGLKRLTGRLTSQ